MKLILLLAILLIGVALIIWVNRKYLYKKPKNTALSNNQRELLVEYVDFYNQLNEEKQKLFEFKVLEFLENTKITGIKTAITELDKLLVASSAIIPILEFPKWKYTHLDEVLLYPNSFNHNYDLEGNDLTILGMVGDGQLERKMILSKQSLLQGFRNSKDKRNTAIHEFIHIIDKADGIIDGVPKVLLNNQYVLPWLDLIEKEIAKIHKGKSDINPYGGTSRVEFFAVMGEYFFERPDLLEKKYPDLYQVLNKIFRPE